MEELEKQLRKQAQILGDLNLELNKFMEDNQHLSLDIVKLEERIAKKKRMIEQEGKDKSIIHEKLIKAQNKKQKLEIQVDNHTQHQTKKQQIVTPEPEIKRPQFLNKPQKKEQPVSKVEQKENNEYKSSGKGQYKSPLLLMPADQQQHKREEDKEQQNQEQEQDDEKLLESVRSKLQDLTNEDEEQQAA